MSDKTKKKENSDSSKSESENRQSSSLPVKLFIGQIPKGYNVEQIKNLFTNCGKEHIKDVHIITDPTTGQSKGCAFVTLPSKEIADEAIAKLNEKVFLPGVSHPLRVKYADGEVAETRLFVGRLPRDSTEEDLRELFAPYGHIEEISILYGPSGEHRGCAFVRYQTKEEAMRAMAALDCIGRVRGCQTPITVRLKETEKEKQKRKALQMAQAQLQRQVVMATSMWPYNVVNPALLNNPAYSQLAQAATKATSASPTAQVTTLTNTQTPIPTLTTTPTLSSLATTNITNIPNVNQAQQAQTSYALTNMSNVTNVNDLTSLVTSPFYNPAGSQREGPPGANLFIFYVPPEWTDNDLVLYFRAFGNLVSAKIFVDKYTGLSKGFGFVSYDNPASAELAIKTMNGFAIGNKRLRISLRKEKNPTPYSS